MDKTNKILLVVLILIVAGGITYLSFFADKKSNQGADRYENLSQEERQRRNIDKPEQKVYLEVDRIAFEEYLKENISALSPEKSVLGGEFMVTNIDWINNNTAFVYYEDGHVAYEGEVKFMYDNFENKNILVDHFYPLPSGDAGLDENGEPIESEDTIELE